MPNKMSVDRDENGHLYYTYYRGPDEAIKNMEFAVTLRPSDVLHIPGLGFDGLVGYSRIRLIVEQSVKRMVDGFFLAAVIVTFVKMQR